MSFSRSEDELTSQKGASRLHRWLIDALCEAALGRSFASAAADPKLSAEVAELSRLYTRDRERLVETSQHFAARVAFFAVRDLPKVQGPLRDLERRGHLPKPIQSASQQKTMRILDLGAGVGTSAAGMYEFFCGREDVDRVEVESVERAANLVRASAAWFRGIEESRKNPGTLKLGLPKLPQLSFRTQEKDLLRMPGLLIREPKYNFVVLGFAWNEIAWPDATAPAKWLKHLSTLLTDDGVILFLEPALRDTARKLQGLRDRVALAASSEKALGGEENELEALRGLHVLGPCTHLRSCPLLLRERDWCYDEQPVSLPEDLIKVAKGAGLRFEGASYSYLALGRKFVAPVLPPAGESLPVRVVGGPIVSKGQCELHLCAPSGLLRYAIQKRDRQAFEEGSSRHRGEDLLLSCDRENDDALKVESGFENGGEHRIRADRGYALASLPSSEHNLAANPVVSG